MIKINLLGVAPPPTKAAPGPPATKVFQAVTFVGALIVSFAIVGVIYKIWSNQVAELEQRLKQEKIRQSELAGVKAQNEKYQQRLKDLETRINTIQALQNSRVGPVEMMSTLGNVVNRTSDVYLYTLAPAADRILLKGQSGTVDSMANFLGYLKNSGYFQNVQLQQFYEDDQHARVNYKFTMDCLFKSPTGAVTAPAPAAPQGAAPHGTAPPAPAPRPVGR
jgi:Tfp pilus assembly protein PilN